MAYITQGGERFYPFGTASPLSACPLWICLSDKIPWRLLAAVLISAHLMIQLSVMQPPTWVQVHQKSPNLFSSAQALIQTGLSPPPDLSLPLSPSLSLSGTLSFPCTPLHDRFGSFLVNAATSVWFQTFKMVHSLTWFMYHGNFLSIYFLHYTSW